VRCQTKSKTLSGELLGVVVGERGRGSDSQNHPECHIHLGLDRGVLRPVPHEGEGVLQRGEKALAGLLQALPIKLRDVLSNWQVEQRQLVVAQPFFDGASLLGIEAGGELRATGNSRLPSQTGIRAGQRHTDLRPWPTGFPDVT